MKVLLVLGHSGFFRHFDTVVAQLLDQGHHVHMVTRGAAKHDIDTDYQREMLSTLIDHPRGSYSFDWRRPRALVTLRVRRLRGILDYGHYFRVQHNSPQLAPRMARLCPAPLRPLFSTRAGRRLVSNDSFMAAYRRFQAHLPADRRMIAQVRQADPDVVVACPYVYRLSGDIEYVRAAQKLGIPTVGVVASWDNLSTKGTFPLLPDTVVVWNDGLAKEGRTIHALPSDSTVVTGAAKFDHYFELKPSEDREAFCARVGIDPGRPYLLYIGSSEQVAGDETGFVSELEEALQADPRTRELQVVVRPHPLNGKVWKRFRHDRIVVYPRGGQRPDIAGPRDDYFHSLHYSAAVAGVNTSAFLEAAITDRPCLSIVSDRHREGQIERGHFQHLLKGRFIETVPDFAGAVDALAEIVAGNDPRQGMRRRFVESFVRPMGINRQAGEAVAEAILATERRGVRKPEPILPSKRAALPKPMRLGSKGRRPPSDEDERRALLRVHDEHPVPVRQPLVLVSELGGGGGLLNRLLDGHPEVHGHPHRLGIGHPGPDDWPRLDLQAGPDAWMEALREPLAPAGDAAAGVQFLMVPSLYRPMFERCAQQWTPETRRAVLDCHLTAYFNSWLDYQNLYGDHQRWVAAYGGGLGLGEDNQRAFFADYPDGRLVLVLGEPGGGDGAQSGWTQAAEAVLRAREEYGDRLVLVERRRLVENLEGTMRTLAASLEIEFDAALCRPTINGLAAGAPVSSDDGAARADDPRAEALYEQLLAAAS